MSAAVSIIVAVIAGAASALVAPWAKYGVDRRQARTTHRQELIATWRALLSDCHDPTTGVRVRVGGVSISDDPRYLSLRPHLSDELRSALETGHFDDSGTPVVMLTVGAFGFDEETRSLAEQVDLLEKQWKLV